MTHGTRTADYDFSLPPELIAQRPADRRDASRLMVVHRAEGRIEHRTFADLATLVPADDVLVLNTTRVFRARLNATRDSGAPAEVFLLKPMGDGTWEAMVSPGGKMKPGRTVHVAPGFDVEVVSVTERRTRLVRPLVDTSTFASLDDALERHGHVPLPPYIARDDEAPDVERYQTVYAREAGSVAAPTAGLHFTPELLATLEGKGVRRAEVLLHVGAGTFKPVETDDLAAHVMHEEWYRVGPAAADMVNATRAAGGKVWAVGTTSCRTLESAARADGTLEAGEGETRIFIHPPYRARIVDRLVTNFHLPRSTLIMLVAALAGYELTMHAYEEAIRERYRFYSYGDAMVLL
jgi:S-adenosylmethionine:tRNA ribosyltransferase-isomerase